MSEYLAGPQEGSADGGGPAGRARGRVSHVDASRPVDGEREHVRFGIPFNGVVPIWHDDATITWHRPADGTDLSSVLGMGLVESEPGPAQAPAGWQEQVETGTLTDSGRLLLLRAATPSGRRAINDPGDGAPILLQEPLSYEQAMEGVFDVVSFGIHIGRIMLRAARDGGIILFTLRAPRDPEPHHILSVPAQVDDRGVMSFHLGTLQEMEGGAWDAATHRDGMALLDLTVPYADLVAEAGPDGEEGLDADSVLEMAQPVIQCILKPGFPFALGASMLLPQED
ncbi:hypothetical protein HMPREF1549_01426 [Actinomyces johnsonii F0510]|uniref:Uncharacterized protein n=1 Tax=Actinomyces johnsonii F0510 TaxID=1227262 RepID=U1PU80_9ACTO|nr:hypothetical protein [Actinomyces johnsonii]ERH19490.1 hypothetical protein HMPREF1549_01426 [Actinomyces johnsonii F0510]